MSFPDRQTVLDFLRDHPGLTRKQDIARGLNVKGRERQTLRQLLKDMEADGTLSPTGKRAYARSDIPPPTCVIRFERVDDQGDLMARALGKDGPFGPDLLFDGYSGRSRGPAPGPGDRGLARLRQGEDGWTARLIKLFETRDEETPVTGVYEATGRGGRLRPASRKEKRVFLVREEDRHGAEPGDLVRALPLPQRDRGPVRARILNVLGREDDPRAASLLSIAAHDLPTEFPDAVLTEARKTRPAPAPREDIRDLPLLTIDPVDARDHDDAIFAEATASGWRVIIAIADVAAYVHSDTALDQEARRRGNSTYFPDRVIPMLPLDLSAGACSLKEGEDRHCFAVELQLSADGRKQSHRFFRATMRSAAALSYDEAQTAIDGHPSTRAAPLLDRVLRPLWGAYRALEQARADRAPLALDLPERRVDLDEDGQVTGIRTKARYDAHKLVEEMMIQANVAAAEALEKAGAKLLYRIHDRPSDAKMAALAEFLSTLDVKWPLGEVPQTHRFNRLLSDFEDTDSAEAVSEIVLRSQAQAVYSPDNIGHFGLNLLRYAHFTSPIRRYSDLIVHRALITALGLGPDGITPTDMAGLDTLASHLVMTERRSMAAERDANDRYLALFLADQVGAEFDGRITGVTKAGLFVRLAETGADGFLPARTLSHEFWHFVEADLALVADRSGKRYEMGQEVRVRLNEVAPLEGGLLFEMLSPARPSRPGRAPGKTTRSRQTGRPRHRGKPKGRRRS